MSKQTQRTCGYCGLPKNPRCGICGQFVSLADREGVVVEFTPDTHFTSERVESVHRACAIQEAAWAIYSDPIMQHYYDMSKTWGDPDEFRRAFPPANGDCVEPEERKAE